jgi:hypothetical protein
MIDSSAVRRAVQAVKASTRRSTWRFRPLPDFLILGGQRCGTTSLYYYLRAHPRVLPALIKEVHFLTLHWLRGEGWYRAQFPLRARKTGQRQVPLTFEATPYYLLHPLAASRARELVPEVKLLVLLRDPVSRAWSHYRHMVRLGLEPLSFQEAIAQEPVRLAGEVDRIRSDPGYDAVRYRRYSYLTRGAYAAQLQQWLDHFSPDQFLVLRSERLLADPAGGYASVLAFLGLPAWTPSAFPLHTKNPKGSSDMPSGIRRQLEEHFAPATRQLEELLRTTGRQPLHDGD